MITTVRGGMLLETSSSAASDAALPSWFFPTILTLAGGFLVYLLARWDLERKERAERLHDLVVQYTRLGANGATMLTHQAERESFRVAAERLGFTVDEIFACISSAADRFLADGVDGL